MGMLLQEGLLRSSFLELVWGKSGKTVGEVCILGLGILDFGHSSCTPISHPDVMGSG